MIRVTNSDITCAESYIVDIRSFGKGAFSPATADFVIRSVRLISGLGLMLEYIV